MHIKQFGALISLFNGASVHEDFLIYTLTLMRFYYRMRYLIINRTKCIV